MEIDLQGKKCKYEKKSYSPRLYLNEHFKDKFMFPRAFHKRTQTEDEEKKHKWQDAS